MSEALSCFATEGLRADSTGSGPTFRLERLLKVLGIDTCLGSLRPGSP
jgi:hypothetical protein